MDTKEILKKMAAGKEEESHRRRAEEKRRRAEAQAVKFSGARVERGRINEQHNEEKLEPRLMEGVQAEGHRTTTTIPAGVIGNDLPLRIVSEE